MRVLYEQGTEGCIQETVVVEKIVLADGLLEAELPIQLSIMQEAMREMYYPYEKRTEILLADTDGSIQMTFQMTAQRMIRNETGGAAEAVRGCVDRIYPYNSLSPAYLFRDGEIPVGWFTMNIDENGNQFLHIKAVFSVNNQLCLTTITFPELERMKWTAIVKHFFSSLHERGDVDAVN